MSLGIQALAIPGSLLPVLPGLALLPLGALLWIWAAGWSAGWPSLLLAGVLLVLGWGAEALGLVLGPARLQASRWATLGAGLGLLVGLLGLLPALPVGGPLLGLLFGPFLGACLAQWLAARGGLGRALQVGLAVLVGMLVSRLAQALLGVVGVLGFIALTR